MLGLPLYPFDFGPTPRHKSNPVLEFEDTASNADPESDKPVWRDSSLALEHGLDIDELPIDSLPGELRDSFA